MMNFMFRKSSSSIASSASKRTLAALTSIDSFLNCHPSTTEVIVARNGAVGGGIRDFSSFRVPVTSSSRVRHFHVGSGPLHFRASVESQAQFAVDDFSYDEEKSSSKGSSDEGLEISKLGIDQEIVSALAKKGIVKLFPIQRAVLEPAMQGRDMIARARTGTGKTLAFGIPIIDKIIQYNNKHGRGRYPLALVMAPTRELAKQVEKEFYDSAPNLDTLCVYGGTPIGRQMGQLDHGVDIVVGTPGRVIDLMKRGALVLSEIQFVVLDEADQMLAVGFEEDVEMILQKLPANRQSLMFSATMPTWIKQLTQKYLKNPLTIDLVGDSDQKLADGITLFSIASDTYGRASIIGPLITEHAKGGKCIVFTATKRDADRLAYAMGRSFRCEALHGDISQNQRERTLSGFRDGSFNVLVATDVAARGLDIPNVDLVIHYELPNTSEIFVHRSGRTGRAGKKGSAILIHSEQQIRAVKTIERDVGCKFKELPRIAVEPGSGAMFGDIGGGNRFGGIGGGRSSGGPGFGRSSGFNSGGRSSGFNSGGRSGGYSGGGYGGADRSGGYGGNSTGGRFGSFGGGGGGPSSGRSSGGGFGSPSRSGGGFGRSDSFSGRFGGFGDDK